MSKRLHLSPDVSLPLDAVTQTFAILGVRGSGKTVTASVMTEQMIAAGLPVVVVDPIGVWWGLRHSRDGKGPGLSVVILGGEHADVPLEETGGAVIADFVVEHRVPAVLDLGGFSKSAHRRFMVDFAERLYRVNREALHVVLDEADTLCPQRVDHGGERLVGAINDIVRRGRARGLGATLISQRPALISKDVLTQVEALVVHRMTGPQDRDAVERWVEHNADRKQAETVLASLQSLGNGEAWLWSPAWLGLFKRTQIDMRTTFDSSATPKAGAKVARPRHAAEVDLGALREKLAATIERAKQDDPRALRAKITELEKASKAATPKAPPAEVKIQTVEKIVELPAFSAKDRAAVERLAKSLDRFETALGPLQKLAGAVAADARGVCTLADKVADRIEQVRAQVLAGGAPASAPKSKLNGTPRAAAPAAPVKPTRPEIPVPPEISALKNPLEPLPGGHRRVLLALAQHGGKLTKRQIAVFACYKHSGGGFNNILSALRNQEPPRITGMEDIEITMEGRYALGPFDALPEDAESLFQHWMAHPKLGKAHREILRVLRERGGGPLTTMDVAAACEPPYEPGGGGFNNAVGRLRTMGVIEGGKHDLRLIEQLR